MTDAVLRLVALHVRGVDTVQIKPPFSDAYRVDVVPKPIGKDDPDGDPENPSHAQIESDPAVDNDTRFKKLKEALCRLAAETGTWAIAPSEWGSSPR